MLIDLSHRITDGMLTYPGPAGAGDRNASLARGRRGDLRAGDRRSTSGCSTICTNTGTYIDVPFHRYADGYDLADLALEQVTGLPAVLFDRRGVEGSARPMTSSRGWPGTQCSSGPTTRSTSVPIATSRATPTSGRGGEGARARRRRLRRDRLAEHRRNRDGRAAGAHDPAPPGIPIVEHLTNLAALPADGFVHGGAAQDRGRRDVHRARVRGDVAAFVTVIGP